VSERPAGQITTARTLASGVIASAVVHEFANLLTVVDGLRQLRAISGDVSDTALLDGPAAGCEQLVGAFRRLFSRRMTTDSSARDDLSSMSIVLAAHLRGRRTVTATDDELDLVLAGEMAEACSLTFLCQVLALLARCRVSGQDAERVELGAEGSDGRCVALTARCVGVATDVGTVPHSDRGPEPAASLERVAAELADEAGIEIFHRVEPDGGTDRGSSPGSGTVTVRVATARRDSDGV